MSSRRIEKGLAGAAVLFAALGDPARLALMRQLSDEGPLSISRLADGVGTMTRQGVTKHLHVLEAAGLVEGRRNGREHVWTINPGRLADARRSLDRIARQWEGALGRLKAHLEQGDK